MKQLHRLLVTSSAYRMSSRHDEAAARVDADNRYLWRSNRRRLDAESIRDAVLAVSGHLDRRMGGPGYEPFRFKDDHSPIYDHTDLKKVHDPRHVTGTIHGSGVTAEGGDLAAVTSTSGLSWKLPGRLGDSPIVGAGMYCDNSIGSAGATASSATRSETPSACSIRTVVASVKGLRPPSAFSSVESESFACSASCCREIRRRASSSRRAAATLRLCSSVSCVSVVRGGDPRAQPS